MLSKTIIRCIISAGFIILSISPLKAQEKTEKGNAPAIEGTYILKSRDFGAKSKADAIDIQGIMTYTRKYRNFNITWKTPEGKHFSIAYLAEYTLTATAYQETPIYWMMYDESHGAPDFTPPADKAKPTTVTDNNGKISFILNGEDVSVTFDGRVMTALSKNGWTDHWEKIE